MEPFHKNLHFLMRRQNETQQTVAEFVGVTQPSVSNWLKETMPGAQHIDELAKLFAVTVDDLLHTELPHRKDIQALEEVERELRELQRSWGAVAKRLKKSAAKQSQNGDYIAAAQNDWFGSGIGCCSNDLEKLLKMYFPDQADSQTKPAPPG